MIDKEKLHILVVDDHPITRDLVRHILKSLGYHHITTADSGISAQERLRERSFGLIVCDWNMPHCTGLEFLQVVRASESHSDVPFLMLTAEAYRESVKAALDAGVNDYIAKPFTADVLDKKIAGVFNKSPHQGLS